MTELFAAAGSMSMLPTEVLMNIFDKLPTKDHVKCRQVCTRFKSILDHVMSKEAFWHERSKRDFKDIYQTAKRKARLDLWSDVYKSLALWSNVSRATEVIHGCALAPNNSEIVQNVEALPQGVIGIQKRRSIEYYDIDTFQPKIHTPIVGNYAEYTENEDTIIISDFHMNLYVLRKIMNGTDYETNVIYQNVKTFILVNRLLYYATLENKIFVCHLDEQPLESSYVQQCEESVMCFGYKNNCVRLLTLTWNIYSLVNKELILSCHLDDFDNILHEVHHFNLLSAMDWRVCFQWKFIWRQVIPEGPLIDTISVYAYGDVVFVGCYSGLLNIYYKPFVNGKLDFYKAVPVKQYCFGDAESEDCPILKIDVVEVKNGHWVIVAMLKKIAIIKLFHNWMLPDGEVALH